METYDQWFARMYSEGHVDDTYGKLNSRAAYEDFQKQYVKPTVYLHVTEVNFDNLENRDGEVRTVIGLFTCAEAISIWLENRKPVETYTGWDKKIYPYLEAKLVEVIS